jgi:hypothetical protein
LFKRIVRSQKGFGEKDSPHVGGMVKNKKQEDWRKPPKKFGTFTNNSYLCTQNTKAPRGPLRRKE